MTVFFTADLHLGHSATFEKFKRADGSPLRPFTSVEEMNEELVKRWNDTVGPDDRTYLLGDVVMSHRYLPILDRLNGSKVLISGNHDPIGGKKGRKFNFGDYFDYVTALKEYDGMILSHVPVHPQCLDRWSANVHGHLHAKEVMQEVYDPLAGSTFSHETKLVPDPRYLCVSVEHTDYRPISVEDVKQRIRNRGGNV